MRSEPGGASAGFDGKAAAYAHTRPLRTHPRHRTHMGRLQARDAIVSFLVEVVKPFSKDYCYSQLRLFRMVSHSLESC